MEEGEYLIAFLSTTCSHCKVAAQKLGIAQRKYVLPEIKVFYLGSEKGVVKFEQESNAVFDYVLFNEARVYKITSIFPTIFYVKNGQVHQQWNGADLSYNEMAKLSKMKKGIIRAH